MTDLSNRTARFAELSQWTVQTDDVVPQEVRDLIYARKLVTAAAPEGVQGPFRNPAVVTVDDFSLTFAVCPPGQGPGLHSHLRTTETFVCLKGRFRVYWGESGEHETVLDELDLISIPPGVIRGFQNVGDGEGILQVLITGGVHDMNDIWMPRSVVEAIKAHGEDVFAEVAKAGVHFDGE